MPRKTIKEDKKVLPGLLADIYQDLKEVFEVDGHLDANIANSEPVQILFNKKQFSREDLNLVGVNTEAVTGAFAGKTTISFAKVVEHHLSLKSKSARDFSRRLFYEFAYQLHSTNKKLRNANPKHMAAFQRHWQALKANKASSVEATENIFLQRIKLITTVCELNLMLVNFIDNLIHERYTADTDQISKSAYDAYKEQLAAYQFALDRFRQTARNSFDCLSITWQLQAGQGRVPNTIQYDDFGYAKNYDGPNPSRNKDIILRQLERITPRINDPLTYDVKITGDGKKTEIEREFPQLQAYLQKLESFQENKPKLSEFIAGVDSLPNSPGKEPCQEALRVINGIEAIYMDSNDDYTYSEKVADIFKKLYESANNNPAPADQTTAEHDRVDTTNNNSTASSLRHTFFAPITKYWQKYHVRKSDQLTQKAFTRNTFTMELDRIDRLYTEFLKKADNWWVKNFSIITATQKQDATTHKATLENIGNAVKQQEVESIKETLGKFYQIQRENKYEEDRNIVTRLAIWKNPKLGYSNIVNELIGEIEALVMADPELSKAINLTQIYEANAPSCGM